MSRKKIDPLARAIKRRQLSIDRFETRIHNVQRNAAYEIAQIKKRMNVAIVLLEALKRGEIEP